MFKMDDMTITQCTDKVLARVEADAIDQRNGKEENLILYIELTAEEQNAKPIVERALRNLGYLYNGITNVETTSVPFDAEGMFLFGKECEAKAVQK